MGTQKNCLNVTVLFSTRSYVKIDVLENIYIFMLKNFDYLNLCYSMLTIFKQSGNINCIVIRLWCLTVRLLLSHWYPGSGVVLDCIDS